MSRLIDADELKKLYEPYKGLGLKVPCEVICLNIEDQPTIQPYGYNKDGLIEELEEYKSLGFSPEEVAMLARFFKERTSTAAITADMKLLAGYLKAEKYEELEKQNQMPQTGWIPVSSGKLPTKEEYSEDGFVLVQTGGDIIYKGFYEAESGFWVDEVGFKFAYMPIAWQPLPQPYKESK